MIRGRSSLGFTLVELLVVIAVLSVLAALLASALSKTQSGSRRMVCLNQLRQLGILQLTQAQENDFQFPLRGPEADWLEQILVEPVANPTWLICPEDGRNKNAEESTGKKPIKSVAGNRPSFKERSYILNGFSDYFFERHQGFSWKESEVRLKQSAILLPSRTLVFGEKPKQSPMLWADVLPVGVEFFDHLAEGRHSRSGKSEGSKGGTANYFFADGHASAIEHGKATCPENLWCVTDKWRNDAVLCAPRQL